MKESKSDQLLHKAATSGDVMSLAKVLDSGKVHVDCCDEEGTTALMLASANNHMDCVKLLIEEGAEVCAQRQSGTHALFFAAQGGHLDLLRFLINVGSNINLGSKDGGTPLFVAAQCGHLDIVEELVKNGAEIDSEMACDHYNLALRAPIKLPIGLKYIRTFGAFNLPFDNDAGQILGLLDGATPLFIASQNGYTPVVRFLLSKGATVDLKRKDGATPLWIASQMGHASAVKELLRNGADVNCAREDGATPLFKAAHKGHINVIEILIERRAALGVLGNGESALHAASLFGHLGVVKLLVQAGSNPQLRNKSGETPADLAQQMGYDQISDYLKSFGGSKQTIIQNGLGQRPQKCTDV